MSNKLSPQTRQRNILFNLFTGTFGIVILASIFVQLQTQEVGPCSTTMEVLHATGQFQNDGKIRITGTDLAAGDANIYIYNVTTATVVANTASPASSYTIENLSPGDYDIQIQRQDGSSSVYCDETVSITVSYYREGSGTCRGNYDPNAYAYGAMGWNHNANDPPGEANGHLIPIIYNTWLVSSVDETDFVGLNAEEASSQIEVQIDDASAEEAILNGRYAEYRFTTTNNDNGPNIISGIGFSIYDSLAIGNPASGRYKIQVQVDDDAAFASPTILFDEIQIDNEDGDIGAYSTNFYNNPSYTHTHNFYRSENPHDLQNNTTYYIRVYFFDLDRIGYSPNQDLPNSVLWDDVRFHLQSCSDNDDDGIGDEVDIDDDNDGITDLVERGCVDGQYFIGWWHNNPFGDVKQDGFSLNPGGGTVNFWADGQMGADTAVVAGQGDDFVLGTGLSSRIPGSLMTLDGVNQATLLDAISDNDFVEYGFTTGTGFTATLDRFGFAAGDNSAGEERTTGHTLSLIISDDNFSTSDTLIRDHTPALATTWYEYRDVDISKFSYSLNANTQYKLRLYLYAAPAGNADSVNIDDIQLSAIFCIDTDGDGVMDYLDLDSDNDGITDLAEAGGTDTNGDGRTDNLNDTDLDGLMDQFETSNGSTSVLTDRNGDGSDTEGDFDGDGLYNWLDLDSDGDGIVDVLEANGTDSNQDGLVDWTGDNDNDGLTNAVDSDNGNNYDAENPSIALIITNADSDGDAFPEGAYPRANFDSNGNSDYLDIDADDDGITDNTEAQATTVFVAPLGTDSDLDGIVDNYDSAPYVFGGSGIVPANTDGDAGYDFRDDNADNDAESDLVEAHDSDNDGIADGGSVANTGIRAMADVDGDGLDDGFDNNIGSADPTNTNLSPMSFPIHDNGSDRDWRVDIILPVNWLSFQAEWQGNDAQLRWETAQESNTKITFVIERKLAAADGFQVISSQVEETEKPIGAYAYTDIKAKRYTNVGEMYYRIKQVDPDGKFVYSPVVKLTGDRMQTEIEIFPNPSSQIVNLYVNGPIQIGDQINVIAQDGRIVHSQAISNIQQYTFRLDVSEWAKGFYFVKVEGEQIKETRKLIVR